MVFSALRPLSRVHCILHLDYLLNEHSFSFPLFLHLGEWDALEISAASLKREKFTFDVAFTSCLRRANQTLDVVLKELNLTHIPVHQLWRLNERHYGALTGFNKRQMADIYGEQQVQVWRRSFNVPPPPIDADNPYYSAILNNPKFRHINEKDFPLTETLETTMQRVVPEWTDTIIPEVRAGKKVLVVAHGTSLRGLVKHIQGKGPSVG